MIHDQTRAVLKNGAAAYEERTRPLYRRLEEERQRLAEAALAAGREAAEAMLRLLAHEADNRDDC